MKGFIYAFTEEDRDKLISLGFTILKQDMIPYVFTNNGKIKDNFEDMKLVFNDEMLFE